MGACGVGSGILLITGLASLPQIGLTKVVAIGTSCPAQTVCALSGAGAWMFADCVDFGVAVCIGAPGLVGTMAGIRLANSFSDAKLRWCFGALMLALAPVMVYRAVVSAHDEDDRHAASDAPPPPPQSRGSSADGSWAQFSRKFADDSARLLDQPSLVLQHSLAGCIIGVVTGMLAAGDTPIIISYMTMRGYTQKEAIGTAMAATIPWYVLMSVMHLARGTINVAVATVTVVVMGVCGFIGGRFASESLSDQVLQLGFAVFLSLIGPSLMFKALRGG